MHKEFSKPELHYEIKNLKNQISELKRGLLSSEKKAQAYQKTLEVLALRESELRATLYGIGDAVISTDNDGCVTRMNRTAEDLTGWPEAEAVGLPLENIFNIVNEETRCRVENPATTVLEKQTVCGLANHTILISKNGREIPISDSGAPIFDAKLNITGVVLVFRDQSRERLNQRLVKTRLSLIEYSENHTLEELLTRALDKVGAFVDSPIGFYHFVEPDQKTLSLQQWSTRTLEEFCKAKGRGMHYGIDRAGVWVDCVRKGKPVVHNDYDSLLHKKGLPEGHAKVIRELVVPVFRDGKMVAILGVGNKPEHYTQNDVNVVSLLADITWEIVSRKRIEEEAQHSNEMLRAVVDAAPVAIFDLDLEGRVRSVWNKAAEKMFGWRAGEVMGRPLPTVPAEYREEFSEFRKRERNGIPMTGEMVCRQRQDGSLIDCNIYSAPLYDVGGAVKGNVAAIVDITELKLAEQERQTRLKYFKCMDRINRAIQKAGNLEQMMQDLLSETLSILDCERVYLMYPCDPDAKFYTVPVERSKPGYAGYIYSEKRSIPSSPGMSEMLRALLDAEGPLTYGPGMKHLLPDHIPERYGFKSMITIALHPKLGKSWQLGVHQCSFSRSWTPEEVTLVQEIGRRMTDALTSLLMYKDLKESENLLNRIVESIPAMITLKDVESLRFVKCNSACEALLGHPQNEILGKDNYDLFSKNKADFFTEKEREAIKKGCLVNLPDVPICDRDNEERVFHIREIPIMDKAGKPQYLLGISEDITERRQMDESIRKLSQAIEQSPVSFVITDTKGTIEFVNHKFTEITGYSRFEALGQNPRLLKSGETSTEEYQRLWEIIGSGEVWKGEFHNRKKDGDLFWEHATIAPIRDSFGAITHYVGIKEDITERKKLEVQFQQAQKMESIGRLAGGVAHDFNNLLSVVIGNTNLAMEKTGPDSLIRSHLEGIQKAAERSADLTRQLLAFARRQAVSPKVIDLNNAVEGVSKMLRRMIGENIDLSLDLTEGTWPVKIDPSQIDQIMANLCVNARDAIDGVGSIIIETGNVSFDEPYCSRHAGFVPGQYALLAVSDNGCGMNENLLDKIFEPFFTTKELGKGTGLGLATVYGIVKQNNGFINFYSEPGQGSTAKIYLPRHKSESGQIQAQPQVASIVRGKETILIVEDDPAILEMTQEMLERIGYHVLPAVFPEKAVQVARKYEADIHLLLTDVIMPQMNGRDLADKIRLIHPEVKCLFMSGYTRNIIAHNGVLSDGFDFLQKPFTVQFLSKKIREVLDNG